MKAIVQYKKTNECDDRSTVDKIVNFCKKAEIDTYESSRSPLIRIKEYDDGDQGVQVEIEVLPHCDKWSKSVYEFIGKLWKKFPSATLYPETVCIDGCGCYQYRLDICTYACNPS